MRSRADGSMPAPLSMTSTTASPDASATRMRIRPPEGLNLIALSTRLISAWRTTNLSAYAWGAPTCSTSMDCPCSSASTSRWSATSSASSRTSNSSVDSLACRVSARDSVKQSIDEARKPIGFLEHAADDRPVGCIVPMLAKPHFADAAHRGERRAELVRHVGRETAHLLERRFEAPERLVEHHCQTAPSRRPGFPRAGDRSGARP